MVCGTCGAAWLLGARAHTALKRGAGLRLHTCRGDKTKPTQDLRANTTLYALRPVFTSSKGRTDYASEKRIHALFFTQYGAARLTFRRKRNRLWTVEVVVVD